MILTIILNKQMKKIVKEVRNMIIMSRNITLDLKKKVNKIILNNIILY
jgi:hypothetical protein